MNTQSTIIDFTSNVLDVRDIIERYEELESDLLDCFNEQQEIEGDDTAATSVEDSAFQEWLKVTVHEDAQEFASLRDLLGDLKGSGGDEQWRGDWYPLTLINENYFTEYMADLIKDCYSLDFPQFVEVDWETTADNCKEDYTFITINGTEYWFR